MNVGQFITRFRSERADTATPYLWSDAEIADWLNDAIEEACQRAHILEDATSAFTSFTVAAGTEYTALPDYVLKLIRVTVDGQRIDATSIEELDANHAYWETQEGDTQGYIHGRDGTLRLYPLPAANVAVKLRVSRLPVDLLSADIDAEEIPLPRPWHAKLFNWVHRCALMKNDTETQDLSKAADFEAAFIRDFGIREDANVERKHRDKTPPVVQFRSF
jgi:hypothetical protein